MIVIMTSIMISAFLKSPWGFNSGLSIARWTLDIKIMTMIEYSKTGCNTILFINFPIFLGIDSRTSWLLCSLYSLINLYASLYNFLDFLCIKFKILYEVLKFFLSISSLLLFYLSKKCSINIASTKSNRIYPPIILSVIKKNELFILLTPL